MHFLSFPQEILEAIALQLAGPRGPPATLLPLLFCCKQLYFSLGHPSSESLIVYQEKYNPSVELGSTQLYADIFRVMFDTAAPMRRLGPDSMRPGVLSEQLREWCTAMKVIASGDIYDDRIETVLWTAYLMLLENDGRNHEQLLWAGLSDFVDSFVRKRLWEDADLLYNGWPAENIRNALAVWLMYMTSSEGSLQTESEANRKQIERLMLPYVLLQCRYPSSHAPPNHFTFPLHEVCARGLPTSVVTAHGPYPIYASLRGSDPGSGSAPVASHRQSEKLHQNAVLTFSHYGLGITISPPLIAPAAALIFTQRREQRHIQSAPHFAPTRIEWQIRYVARAVAEFEAATLKPVASGTPDDDSSSVTHANLLASWEAERAIVLQNAELHARTQIIITKEDVEEWDRFKGAKPCPQVGFNWSSGLNTDEESPKAGAQVFQDHMISPQTGVLSLADSSLRWEADFARVTRCWSPFTTFKQPGNTYRPGSLTGLWHGRSQIPPEEVHWGLLTTARRPPQLDDSSETIDNPHNVVPTSWPIFLRLTEHHCLSPNSPSPSAMKATPPSGDFPFGGAPAPIPAAPGSVNPNPTLDEGQMNAWLSNTTRIEQRENHVLVIDDAFPGHVSRYETHDGATAAGIKHDSSVCRVCVGRATTAEEDDRARRSRRKESDDVLVKVMEKMCKRAEYANNPDAMDRDDLHVEYSDDEDEDDDDEMDVDVDESNVHMFEREFDDALEGMKAFNPDSLEPVPCFGIEDTIVTGRTDERHGQAWNHYTYFGRVRSWDGLVCIVRVPRDPQFQESHRLVFTGNIIASQTLVGMWRKMGRTEADGGADLPGYSGIFVMSRRHD